MDEVVKLNVSGKPLDVRKDTLTKVPGSNLQVLFSGIAELKKTNDERVQIDRDPETF